MNIINLKDDIPTEILKNIKSVAIDTETTGLNLFRDRLCLIQMNFGDDNCYLLRSNNFSCARNFISILNNESILKIFHFARFDVSMLKMYVTHEIKNIYCTKIASKIARTYSPKHSLKDLVKEFIHIDLQKEEQSSYWGGDELSDSQMKYAANDVMFLHGIMKSLNNILIRENRMDYAKKCFNFLDTVTDLDIKGYDLSYIISH